MLRETPHFLLPRGVGRGDNGETREMKRGEGGGGAFRLCTFEPLKEMCHADTKFLPNVCFYDGKSSCGVIMSSCMASITKHHYEPNPIRNTNQYIIHEDPLQSVFRSCSFTEGHLTILVISMRRRSTTILFDSFQRILTFQDSRGQAH